MTWFDVMIQVCGVFYYLPFLRYWFFPLVGLAFLASVPRLLRAFIIWR